jgi:hypothetical protein
MLVGRKGWPNIVAGVSSFGQCDVIIYSSSKGEQFIAVLALNLARGTANAIT